MKPKKSVERSVVSFPLLKECKKALRRPEITNSEQEEFVYASSDQKQVICNSTFFSHSSPLAFLRLNPMYSTNCILRW